MFRPPPEVVAQSLQIVAPKKKSRKAKKKSRKNKLKKEPKRRNTKFVNTMSAWAENFAVAATWQLKHQIAYWKARAKALEYENKILHNVIRRNNLSVSSTTNTECETRTATEIDETDMESNGDNENIAEDNGLEVSEEFIQFLTANAKFKEDAKRERELLKAKNEQKNEIDMQEPEETTEETRERMKDLYGDKWQQISSLEMTLLSRFLQESEKSKLLYWPNIPFNFNNSCKLLEGMDDGDD